MDIQENIPLAPYTTLKIGGPARYFVEGNGSLQLSEAYRFAKKQGVPAFILGGGSNLVIADAGFPGLVLRIADSGARPQPDAAAIGVTSVDAGVEWDTFVRNICELGLSGIECLAGIPGTVGGAPVQNIGAYGQEVSQTIESVLAYDSIHPGKGITPLKAADCEFSYRRSIFNSTRKNRYAIRHVDFRFDPNARPNLTYPDLARHFAGKSNPTPLEVYHAVRAIRAAKGMLIDRTVDDPDTRSAGSFFKNPVVPLAALGRIAARLGIPAAEIKHWPVLSHPESADPGGTVAARSNGQTKLPAAWLVERAGFPKGFSLGPAGISTKHTLALVNRTGTATCADLLALRDYIVAGVERAFGITLEQEPVYLR